MNPRLVQIIYDFHGYSSSANYNSSAEEFPSLVEGRPLRIHHSGGGNLARPGGAAVHIPRLWQFRSITLENPKVLGTIM